MLLDFQAQKIDTDFSQLKIPTHIINENMVMSCKHLISQYYSEFSFLLKMRKIVFYLPKENILLFQLFESKTYNLH
jgi:hypothetical protein